MTHPPQEGSNRGLPSGTLLSVLWQMGHVWITYGITSGFVQVTHKQKQSRLLSTIHMPTDIFGHPIMLGTPIGCLVGMT